MGIEDHINYVDAEKRYAKTLAESGPLREFLHNFSWRSIAQRGMCIPGVQPENITPAQIMFTRASLLENMVEDRNVNLTTQQKAWLEQSLKNLTIQEFEHNSFTHPLDREALFMLIVTIINQLPSSVSHMGPSDNSKPVFFRDIASEIADDMPNVLLREEQSKYLTDTYLRLIVEELAQPISDQVAMLRARSALSVYLGQLEQNRRPNESVSSAAVNGTRMQVRKLIN